MFNKKIQQVASAHHNKAARRLITKEVPIVDESATVGSIEQLLLQKTKEFETINYIYVVNNNKELKGVVSIKEVFRSAKNVPVKELFPKKIISVHEHTHQERVAFLALKNNLKAIPVVDSNNHFLGVVSSDTILSVLDSEAVEDLLRFGGIFHTASFDDVFHLSILKSLKHRLPWLLLGLFGGILASGIVSSFEEVLSKNIILAAFIPLIVYMADAVGTQMEAFIIRDLAVDNNLKFPKYFLRQFSIVFLIAMFLSFLLYGGGILFYGNAGLSLVISLSLFLAIISSLITGLVVPFIFSKFKLDPANASGPIATIIQDITSVFLYFSIASLIL